VSQLTLDVGDRHRYFEQSENERIRYVIDGDRVRVTIPAGGFDADGFRATAPVERDFPYTPETSVRCEQ
jgi:hypothetical protein